MRAIILVALMLAGISAGGKSASAADVEYTPKFKRGDVVRLLPSGREVQVIWTFCKPEMRVRGGFWGMMALEFVSVAQNGACDYNIAFENNGKLDRDLVSEIQLTR